MGTHSFTTEKDEVDEYLNRKDNKSKYLRELVRMDMRGPNSELIGLEMQIQTLEKQAQAKAQEEEILQNQAEQLRELKQEMEGRDERRIEEAREELKDTPKKPTNPAIQTWAERMNLTPEELCDRLE